MGMDWYLACPRHRVADHFTVFGQKPYIRALPFAYEHMNCGESLLMLTEYAAEAAGYWHWDEEEETWYGGRGEPPAYRHPFEWLAKPE